MPPVNVLASNTSSSVAFSAPSSTAASPGFSSSPVEDVSSILVDVPSVLLVSAVPESSFVSVATITSITAAGMTLRLMVPVFDTVPLLSRMV